MKCVILAGGSGSRFWPKSRNHRPKQLLKIVNNKSMLQITIDRIKKVKLVEEIFIITRSDLYDLIVDETTGVPEKNIIIEPSGKNTAPAIGMMACLFAMENQNQIMGVFPADHLIMDQQEFEIAVLNAYKTAKEGENLVTIGIKPHYPSTAYGYIQYDEISDKKAMNAFPVKTFAEKPHEKLAERFLSSGEFLWNGGMFFWEVSTFMKSMNRSMPKLMSILLKIAPRLKSRENIEKLWNKIEPESIDYGLLEKSENIYVVTANFKWNDIGSWRSLYDVLSSDENGNIIRGDSMVMEGSENLIDSEKKFTAVIGLDNIVVINTEDATLIVDKNKVEKVKDLVEFLKKSNKKDLI
jgi:mannose-1-phosphate guanylyltransferase